MASDIWSWAYIHGARLYDILGGHLETNTLVGSLSSRYFVEKTDINRN